MVIKNSEKYSLGFLHFEIEYQVCLLIGVFCGSENNGNCEDQSGISCSIALHVFNILKVN